MTVHKFVLASILFATITGTAVAQGDWRTFRNSEYRFRFIYPPTWHVSTPRGPNVRALVASGPENQYIANCNIVVRAVKELAGYKQKELDVEIIKFGRDDWADLMGDKGAMADAQILEARATKIDNQPAQLAIIEHTYETVAMKMWFRAINVFTLKPGQFWHMTCGAGGSSPEEMRVAYRYWAPVLTRIMSSLVFEQ